jgi:hypothetical protein
VTRRPAPAVFLLAAHEFIRRQKLDKAQLRYLRAARRPARFSPAGAAAFQRTIMAEQKTEKWRETITQGFEDSEHLDEETIIITGLLMFDAIRNSCPQVDVDDVIGEVARAICLSLGLKRLLDQGRIEKYRGADGRIRYREIRFAPSL